jgi:pSer/pThr/pTyr-binding forkhead associated (FHA) protein
MIQLQILSGKQAGNRWVARRFPVRVGRDAGNDLRLEEDGVWGQHCEIAWDVQDGLVLSARPNALLTVNSERVAEPRHLRNGDSIELGSARLRFWLGDPVVRGSRVRELFVWTLIALMCVGQVALVYWLLNES